MISRSGTRKSSDASMISRSGTRKSSDASVLAVRKVSISLSGPPVFGSLRLPLRLERLFVYFSHLLTWCHRCQLQRERLRVRRDRGTSSPLVTLMVMPICCSVFAENDSRSNVWVSISRSSSPLGDSTVIGSSTLGSKAISNLKGASPPVAKLIR